MRTALEHKTVARIHAQMAANFQGNCDLPLTGDFCFPLHESSLLYYSIPYRLSLQARFLTRLTRENAVRIQLTVT